MTLSNCVESFSQSLRDEIKRVEEAKKDVPNLDLEQDLEQLKEWYDNEAEDI